jgi:protein required for attachment to host cells
MEKSRMDTIIVAVNGARARFFTLQPQPMPIYESGPCLAEHKCLVNPELDETDQELWSDDSGAIRSNGGGAHGFDDHRDKHRAELERRFARLVAAETLTLANDRQAGRVILTAKGHMLGLLRKELSGTKAFELKEVDKDYNDLPAQALHERLADLNLLPALREPLSR